MNRSEQETREQLIDPKLRLANWDILEEKYIVEKNTLIGYLKRRGIISRDDER